MSFPVPADGFDSEVAALRAKGVTFQTFEAEGLGWDDGVASYGDTYRSVWFEDPDGNILNVVANPEVEGTDGERRLRRSGLPSEADHVAGDALDGFLDRLGERGVREDVPRDLVGGEVPLLREGEHRQQPR